ncbi:MAG: extracellular solute-binding protein [Dehalococcoidia bacterium]|nr:extracellular solute-binding protein [Dehalococcoidia bacterium]
MMRKKFSVFLLVLMAAVVILVPVVACKQAAAPTAAPTAAPAPARTAVVTPKPPDPWEELVKAAKAEGSLTLYTTAIAPLVTPLQENFGKKYGINLEFVQGRPTEVQAKIKAERNAGIFLADVGHLGETTSTIDVKPQGWIIPVEPLLFLPEVKDPGNWIGNKLPYTDKEKYVLMFVQMAIPHAVANSDTVKEGQLTSFLDLLKPEWKGKIVFSDPAISGTSPNLLTAFYEHFGEAKAMEIFQQLKAQEPVITRDQRQLLEWVAKDKYPIGLGQSMSLFSEFKRAQAPVRTLNFSEPRFISGGPGNLVIFDKAPHPNAAKLYANWLLSKEGMTLWSTITGWPPTRKDVPTGHLDPESIPNANDIFPTEDHLKLRLVVRKIGGDLFKE